MLAEAAGHRLGRGVEAGQANRQPARVEREMLARLIAPGPFAGRMLERQLGLIVGGEQDGPGPEPALAVEHIGVAGHVRFQHDLPPAEGEAAAANAVDEGHQGEAGRLQHINRSTVASAHQRRPGNAVAKPVETGDTAADRRI
jgi:hypothetical protein